MVILVFSNEILEHSGVLDPPIDLELVSNVKLELVALLGTFVFAILFFVFVYF